MLDRVACLPCLLAQGTRLGGVAFCHVNSSSRVISANRGEINREKMAARSEYFFSYHLPVLSAKQNDSQSEEINVKDESQRERIGPYPHSVIFVMLSGRSRDNSRSTLRVPVR